VNLKLKGGLAERSNAPDLRQKNVCRKGETQDRFGGNLGLSANAGSNPASPKQKKMEKIKCKRAK
jgi:hypothetical protein